jgi:hypothetical protein
MVQKHISGYTKRISHTWVHLYGQKHVSGLYHTSASEGRGLFALHIPASNMVSVVVVNPFQNRELSSGQIEKQFREGLRCSGASNVDTHFDSIPTVFKVRCRACFAILKLHFSGLGKCNGFVNCDSFT